MRQKLLLWLLIAGGQIALTASVVADDPAANKPVPAPAEVEQLIADLNAAEFARRESATKRLTDIGPAAAPALVAAAQTGSLETTVRAVAILRSWYTSGRDESIEVADTAFETLAQSKNRHAAGRAAAVLEQYSVTIRQDRALAEIQKLGGQINRIDRTSSRVRAIGPAESEPFFVVLGRDWRGGEQGLKHIRRLAAANFNVLYLLRDRTTGKVVTPGLTNDSVEELQRAMPQLRIQYRGPAFLGISGDAFAAGCRVETLSEGSPADKAKLQAGDVIAKFDGKLVRNFEELVSLIAEKQPGDTIKLEILRGDEDDLITLDRLQSIKGPGPPAELAEKLRKKLAQEISVTLGEWGAK